METAEDFKNGQILLVDKVINDKTKITAKIGIRVLSKNRAK